VQSSVISWYQMDSYVWVLHFFHDVIVYPVNKYIKMLQMLPVPTPK